jgi:hypothetical protein
MNSIDYVYTQTTQLQLHSQAKTADSVCYSTTSDTAATKSPQSPQSMPLAIVDQEEQTHDSSLIQIHESEQMNVVVETTSSSSPTDSEIEQTSNKTRKYNNSSKTQYTVLKDTTNMETPTRATKGQKRKLPSPPKQRKLSSRLAAKRSRQNVSSFQD